MFWVLRQWPNTPNKAAGKRGMEQTNPNPGNAGNPQLAYFQEDEVKNLAMKKKKTNTKDVIKKKPVLSSLVLYGIIFGTLLYLVMKFIFFMQRESVVIPVAENAWRPFPTAEITVQPTPMVIIPAKPVHKACSPKVLPTTTPVIYKNPFHR